MTLIKSISGIRGTIGNYEGDNLTPGDIVRFTSAFGYWIKQDASKLSTRVVIGRDARPSGNMVYRIVSGTLMAMGIDVVNLGPASTPTVEMAVINEGAQGGIIITASHNPVEWNALKLLDHQGEFLKEKAGKEMLSLAEQQNIAFAQAHQLGKEMHQDDYLAYHIDQIMDLPLVDADAISSRSYTIVVDGINSVGGIAIPQLLDSLNVQKVIPLNCTSDGFFAHNPEPLPEHLTGITRAVKENNADLGFVVDPDVDRLAIVDENGNMFGEEYTLVAVADYILAHNPGNTVSNLSSTKALGELTRKYGAGYFPSAVGEVNVVEKMKETDAVIGGEGNGGVIYPDLHYGRDALVGVALFLSFLARSGLTCSQLRKKYPFYHISKEKIQLTPGLDLDYLLKELKDHFKENPVNDTDGLKITFSEGWVHLRKSNTEPVIRLYVEADDSKTAANLAGEIKDAVNKMI